jgi:hypothetical protein
MLGQRVDGRKKRQPLKFRTAMASHSRRRVNPRKRAWGARSETVAQGKGLKIVKGVPTAMKPSSLLIAALAAGAVITSAHAAKPPRVGDIITLQVQTLACFDLENTKELERTRAMDGLSAALHFVNRHPLPDNPAPGTGMFTNVCSRFGPSGMMYLVKKVYDWTSGGLTLFCIDPATKWDLGPSSEKKDPPAESADNCWWARLDY